MAATVIENEDGFLASIRAAGGRIAAEKTERLLEILGLPDPRKGEFYQAGQSRILYTPHGVSMAIICDSNIDEQGIPRGLFSRLLKRKKVVASPFLNREVVHPVVLQPLFAAALSPSSRIEIVPGVSRERTDVADYEAERLSRRLEEDGLLYLSPDVDDVGFVHDRERDRTEHVLLNRGAIVLKNEAPLELNLRFQSRVFGPLNEGSVDLAVITEPGFVDYADEGKEADSIRHIFGNYARNVSLDPDDPVRVLYPDWQRAILPQTKGRRLEVRQCGQAYAERIALAA